MAINRALLDEYSRILDRASCLRPHSAAEIEEAARRLSAPDDVLRFVHDVEVELEAGEVHDVTSFGDSRRHVFITHPEPHPPRCLHMERHESVYPIRYADDPHWMRGRGDIHDALMAEFHFGDHREKWYFNPRLAERALDLLGRDRLMDCFEDVALVVMKAARMALRHVLRAGLSRSFMVPVSLRGRRLQNRREYEEFITLGDFPRPAYRTGFQVPANRRVDPEDVADQSPDLRRQYERDPVGFAAAVMGEWNPEPVREAARQFGEAARQVGVTAAEAARNIAAAVGTHLSGGWDDGWFDQFTVNREADARAERLLLSRLTDAQRDEYRQRKRITLKVKSGRRYVLERGWSYNVTQLTRGGKPRRKLCVVTDTPFQLPMADVLLTQMVLLCNDERGFLKTANSYRVDGKAERHARLRNRRRLAGNVIWGDEAYGMPILQTEPLRFPE